MTTLCNVKLVLVHAIIIVFTIKYTAYMMTVGRLLNR